MSSLHNHKRTNPFVQVGMVLDDRFEICELLGNGGMGTVYRVKDRFQNNQTLALKLLHPHLANDPDAFQRFEREVRVASSLDHETIVKTHSIGQLQNGQLYLTLEYVDGLSLKQYLAHKNLQSEEPTGLPFKTAMIILYQLLQGVSYAHRKGVIHRDLKPANVMVSSTGRIKVVDFGTAKLLDATKTITATGEVIGTPQYMSPEQVKGEQAGPESDVYCLGIIGYELVAGKAPFTASTLVAIALQHLSEPLPDFEKEKNLIPDWYEKLIRKAAAKDPKDRFATTAEFAKALEKYEPQVKNFASANVKLQVPKQPNFKLRNMGFPLYRAQKAVPSVVRKTKGKTEEVVEECPIAAIKVEGPDFMRRFTAGFCTTAIICAIGFPLLHKNSKGTALEAIKNLPKFGISAELSAKDKELQQKQIPKKTATQMANNLQTTRNRHLRSPLSIIDFTKEAQIEASNDLKAEIAANKLLHQANSKKSRLILSLNQNSLAPDQVVKSDDVENIRWGAALPEAEGLGSDVSMNMLAKEFSLNIIEPTSGRTLKKLEPNQVKILRSELLDSDRQLIVSGTLASLRSMYLPTGRYKLELVHMGRRIASQPMVYRIVDSEYERIYHHTKSIQASSKLTPGASAVTILTPPK